MCCNYLEILKRVGRPTHKEAKAQHNALQAFRIRHASMEGTQQAEIPEAVIPAIAIANHNKKSSAIRSSHRGDIAVWIEKGLSDE